MKRLIIIIGCLIPFLYACQSDVDENVEEIGLCNNPIGEVTVNVSDEIFTVDFGFDDLIGGYITSEFRQDVIEKIKTRGKLISSYANRPPVFQLGYESSYYGDEHVFVKMEYLLSQECFQDNCSSQVRKKAESKHSH